MNISLSIVVPAFNESSNIAPLVDGLLPILDSLMRNYEVIIVDDGSSDETWSQISEVARKTPTIRGIKLSRNFGHQHALLAGIHAARGDAVISMDADLQHPPEVIVKLISHWDAGSKIVYTKRVQEEKSGLFKRLSSRYFYRVFSWLSGVQVSSGTSDFRLLDRQVINELKKFQDVDLFLRGAVQWLGFANTATTVEFQVGQRHAENSKYSLRQMIGFASTAIVSFSTKPLIVGIWLGIITSFLAFLELVYILYKVYSGVVVPGWASTLGVIAFLFGILFMILGVIGTYLASIHTALQSRPKYVIEEITSHPISTQADMAEASTVQGK